MKPFPPPKYFASTFFQDILTHLEDDRALWSTSTQPLKFVFVADKAVKDTLPLLTALPHIQHAAAKENRQPSHFLLWSYHAKPIWFPAGSLLCEVGLTLRGCCGGGQMASYHWGKAMASAHLHCPHQAPAAWRLAAGEFTQLRDAYRQ